MGLKAHSFALRYSLGSVQDGGNYLHIQEPIAWLSWLRMVL
jgi:hypothetical protein